MEGLSIFNRRSCQPRTFTCIGAEEDEDEEGGTAGAWRNLTAVMEEEWSSRVVTKL